jgi:hypothetical protein
MTTDIYEDLAYVVSAVRVCNWISEEIILHQIAIDAANYQTVVFSS